MKPLDRRRSLKRPARPFSQRQAALLAVSGLTNRQIAERLEIAVRTVEFHRAGSMRKLGCHSAAELKAKLSLVPEAREAFE
ncbi:LuxR C-terminal-related transcriptional regulator [Sutterella wadsworthensis]|uniref:LuxR C-terminal-related transcriptional regulator n=1 Tax=Sutterella wadsworthensis TaxID=40545 RepID=UPI003FEF16E5